MHLEGDVDIGAGGWGSLIGRLNGALKSIGFGSQPTVLYGADSDGFISYLFLKKILRNDGRSIGDARSYLTYQYLFSDVIEEPTKKHEHLVALDVPLIQEVDRLRKKRPYLPILIVDHHGFRGRAPSEDNIEYINPVYEGLRSKERTPVCLMLFHVMLLRKDVSEIDALLLAVGLLGDSALRDFPRLHERLGSLPGVRLDQRNPLQSSIGTLTRAITSTFQLHPNTGTIKWIEEAYDEGDLQALVQSTKSSEVIQAFEDTVDREINISKSKSRKENGWLFYSLSGSEFVSNISARKISNQHVNDICVVEFLTSDICQYEFRYAGRDRNIPEEIRKSGASRYALSFGGHPTACGAIVSREDRQSFLRCLGFDGVA